MIIYRRGKEGGGGGAEDFLAVEDFMFLPRVCQNIKLCIGRSNAGVDGCKSGDDIVKCESCLTPVNDTLKTLKTAADLLSFIDCKLKDVQREDITPKPTF